ncbi:MAG: hypothetical protein E5X69_24150 [Mesorhizobium sp.]|nr:MAG: hypothetical protein E5X69_24150 [Mesorhizobium sp.]
MAENIKVQTFENPASFGHSLPLAIVVSSCCSHMACGPLAAAITSLATVWLLGKFVNWSN